MTAVPLSAATIGSTDSLSALARSLAKPLAHGWITSSQADAAIWSCALHAERRGTLAGDGDPVQAATVYRHITRQFARGHVARREAAVGAIARVLRPLIEIGAPRNRLLAEAHNCNEDHGFVLTEDEVNEVATLQVWRAMQRMRRHG